MAGLGLASISHAAFVLYDDFEGYSAGALSGQGIWEGGGNVTLVEDTGNNYAQFDGAQSSASFVNSTTAIDTATKTTTVFFRMYLPTNLVTGDLRAANNIGLRDSSLSNSFGNNRNQMSMQDTIADSSWDPIVAARDGASTVPQQTIASDTWYNVWMVSDTVANTWSMYMNTGTDDASSVDLLDASFKNMDFRNTTESGSVEFVFGNAGINEVLNGARVDDIYVDVGNSNLTYAIPEPGSLALVGVAITALCVIRRRR